MSEAREIVERQPFFFDPEEFRSVSKEGGHDYSYFLEGEPLKQVLGLFQYIAAEFDLDMQFFEHTEVRREFYEKLLRFMLDVDSKYMDFTEKLIKYECVPRKNFPMGPYANWKNSFRNACYLAFFMHYGQKRKDGSDYIYHPMRTATNQAAKVGLIDIETLCAMVLHDAPEDSHKGIMRLLDLKKEDEPRLIETLYNFISGFLSRDTARLIALVTKERVPGKKTDRTQQSLSLLISLADAVAAGDLAATRALLVKSPDRLDNTETLHAHEGSKQNEIWDETAYILLMLFHKLGMKNLVDWTKDFLYSMDPEVRNYQTHLDKKAREKSDFKMAFRREFQEVLGRLCSDVPDLKEGIHYLVNFRPRGTRFRHREALNRKCDMDTKTASFARQRAFRNYVIVTVLDEDHRESIISAAQKAFEEFFPYDAYYFDKEAEFGSMFRFATAVRPSGAEKKPSVLRTGRLMNMGAGVTYVSSSPEHSRKTFFGSIHSALIDRDPEAISQVQDVFREIGAKARLLSQKLKYLEAVQDSFQPTPLAISGQVRTDLGMQSPSVDRGAFRDPKAVSQALILIKKQAHLMTFPTISVRVLYDGKETTIQIPRGVDARMAVGYFSHFAACCKLACNESAAVPPGEVVEIESLDPPEDIAEKIQQSIARTDRRILKPFLETL